MLRLVTKSELFGIVGTAVLIGLPNQLCQCTKIQFALCRGQKANSENILGKILGKYLGKH